MTTRHLSRLAIPSLLSACLLSACGGGGSDPAPLVPVVPVVPVVLSVGAITSAAPLSYGQWGVINITGTALSQGISLSAPGCSGLTEISGGTDTARSYRCGVTLATALPVTALNSASTPLLATALPVPDPQVTLLTSLGTVVLELYPAKAPLSVNNFLKYTHDGFYAGLIFHRVMAGFMSQGGGFASGLVQKTPTYAAIALESNVGLPNLRGTLAMARSDAFDSATSQFFINAVDNAFLNYVSPAKPQYAVFGKVVTGLSVVDAINAVPTGTRYLNGQTTIPAYAMSDVPLTEVQIITATQTR